MKQEKIENESNFTFQIVENKEDLIGPIYLSDIIIRPLKSEYKIFDKYLIDNYGKTMECLISQIYNINDCPDSLRIKYWLRAYSLETNFYKDMNSDLDNNNTKNYLTFIKLLYFGLSDNFINTNFSNDLYRGARMKKVELQNLISFLKKKSSNIPAGLLYCKSFMSFSLVKKKALEFMYKKKLKNDEVRILFILAKDSELDNKNSTNADLCDISIYPEEKEILLFPFSNYELYKIENANDHYKIYLNYLGKYKKIFKFENQTKLYNSIFKSKFINEIENAGISKPIWLAKKSLCNIFTNESRGSGFCFSIPVSDKKKIPVLMSVNHLLNSNNLKIGQRILIKYDNEEETFSLKIDKETKIFTDIDFDITIIEIKEKLDEINKLIFMEIDEDIFDEKKLNENLNDNKAYILQYAKPLSNSNYNNENIGENEFKAKKHLDDNTKEKNYSIQEGYIEIKEDKIINHNIPTDTGAAGSPILSYKFKVIGYHIGKIMYNKKGFGKFLKLPIQKFLKVFNY